MFLVYQLAFLSKCPESVLNNRSTFNLCIVTLLIGGSSCGETLVPPQGLLGERGGLSARGLDRSGVDRQPG